MSPPEREKPAPRQGRPSLNYTNNPYTTVRRDRRPSTGLRASGFREGYAAALRWSQREFDEHLDEIGRARLGAVVARSEAS
jgi:hypothetical protein